MKNRQLAARLAPVLATALLLAGCERPPPDVTQQGYRGTGMVAVQNPRLAAEVLARNQLPPPLPKLESAADTPLAKDVYQNVQVLTDLNVVEFTYQMTAQANWIAPDQQCAYCHNTENFASDEKYTKVVARRMLQMTRDINMNWQSHVKQTGVTCYTCHRGKPVPEYKWFIDPGPRTAGGMLGNRAGQNAAAASVRLASLPYDPYSTFLLAANPIRVESTKALPADNAANIKAAERTYGLMMHMSSGLGVNCTHCHNSQHFATWTGAPPARMTAWYGIRLVRSLNNDYLVPLQPKFPANRLGPTGDVAKINCETCHQGLAKPLNGVSMLADHPELARIKPPPPPPPAEPATGDAAAGAAPGAAAAAPAATGAM